MEEEKNQSRQIENCVCIGLGARIQSIKKTRQAIENFLYVSQTMIGGRSSGQKPHGHKAGH